jgi:signal transduction histidine kinase
VDLDEIIADTLAGLGVLGRRGIRIGSTSEAPVPPVVMGDRQWIRRAVSNLVQNSLDALAGEPGAVELTVRSSNEIVTLTVEDTGGGVPDERLSELFSPHFSTTTAGSGLGLALVHQVVIRCHGRVSAANGEQGLQVRLEFPAKSVDEPGPANSQAG